MSDHVFDLIGNLRKRAALQRARARRSLESYYPTGAADAFDTAADLLAQAIEFQLKSSVPGETASSPGTDPISARGVEPVRPTSAPLAGPSSTTGGVPPTSSVVGSAPPVTNPTSAPTASGTGVGE